MTSSSGKRKVTKYQRLQKAKARECSTGSAAAKKALTSAKNAYIADAVKKGVTKAEATAKANKVLNKSCAKK